MEHERNEMLYQNELSLQQLIPKFKGMLKSCVDLFVRKRSASLEANINSIRNLNPLQTQAAGNLSQQTPAARLMAGNQDSSNCHETRE